MPETSYYPQIGGGGAGPPAPASAAPAAAESKPPAAEDEAEGDVGETALLPKSILAGKDFKPGDEVVLKVVHLYDDEVEVAYAPEKPSTPPEPGGMSADNEIDAMSSMKGA